jgi:hypothetical protein
VFPQSEKVSSRVLKVCDRLNLIFLPCPQTTSASELPIPSDAPEKATLADFPVAFEWPSFARQRQAHVRPCLALGVSNEPFA